ncbi:MAG: class I SAM-dependent methyltransferase [Nocardioidaceae bacterium]
MSPSRLVDVADGFDVVAERYDLMVAINPGYHRHLLLSARRLRLGGPSPSGRGRLRLLDLGCGTGLSTAALLRAYPGAEVVGVDTSAGMLARARAKSWPAGVRFVQAKAEEVAEALAGEGIADGLDGALAAYLVRNVPDRDGLLATVCALLAPGAPLAVHEYSVADSRRARWTWTVVCRGVVVPAGWVVQRHTALYRYLERSVLGFDGIAEFEARMTGAGLVDVTSLPMTGWQRGIVHTFLGRRPAEVPSRWPAG